MYFHENENQEINVSVYNSMKKPSYLSLSGFSSTSNTLHETWSPVNAKNAER